MEIYLSWNENEGTRGREEKEEEEFEEQLSRWKNALSLALVTNLILLRTIDTGFNVARRTRNA